MVNSMLHTYFCHNESIKQNVNSAKKSRKANKQSNSQHRLTYKQNVSSDRQNQACSL